MELRPYQSDCKRIAADHFGKGALKGLVQLPTASGKTVILSELLKCLNKKTIIIVPKNILIQQTIDKLEKFIPRKDIGICNAELKEKDLSRKVTVSSFQTLVNVEPVSIELMVVDEVHRWSSSHDKIYKNFIEANPKMQILGMTATPYSMSNGWIFGEDKFWDAPIYKKTIKWMTDNGYLCQLVMQESHVKFDLTNVKKTKEDFNILDLERVMLSDEDKIKAQIEDALEKSKKRKSVIWLTVSIRHAEFVHSLVPNSYIIHSKMNKKDRDYNLENFMSNGGHLISVLIASEGFDHEAADCLVLMRPTRSIVLYIQAVGRILRIHKDKKNALLLDYGSVVENLGTIYNININIKNFKNIVRLCVACRGFSPNDSKTCILCDKPFLNMCPYCLQTYLSTEKHSCRAGKNKRDMYKNLTLEAYQKEGMYKITSVKMGEFPAKSGYMCFKINYFNGFDLVVSEFFSQKETPFCRRQFRHFVTEMSTCNDENIGYNEFFEQYRKKLKVPEAIFVVKEGRYGKIIGKRFRD